MSERNRRKNQERKDARREYAHMCQDGHIQIGHNDSGDDELCPLCYTVSALEHIAELAGRNGPPNELDAINEIERRSKTALAKVAR
jgi:hypothetical protein